MTEPNLCAVVVMGVSGSGKSTIAQALAKRAGWTFADGDQFHPQANIDKMSAGQPLTDEDRKPWLEAIGNEIDRRCAARDPFIVACSALKRSYRDILLHGRRDVKIIFLDGSKALIGERLAQRRNHFMPAGLLDSQFAALEVPGADEDVLRVSIDAPVEDIVTEVVRKLPALQGQSA